MLAKASIAIKKTSEAFNKLAILILLPITMLFIVVEVFLRYFFRAPIRGADEISALLFMCVVLSAISYCWIQRGHVRIDILLTRLTRKWEARAWAFAGAVGFFVFSLMAYQSVINIFYSLKVNDVTHELQLILWPFRIYFSLCSILFALQLLVSVFDFISESRTRR